MILDHIFNDITHLCLRVLRSRCGGGGGAVDVDHVADLDGHGAHALLLLLPSLAAQDLHMKEDESAEER